MAVDNILSVIADALFCVIKTALPVLLVSLIIGLIISIFQTVTSIQEQTLTFVPKVICVFLTIILLGHWMVNNMTSFMESLWGNFSLYIR